MTTVSSIVRQNLLNHLEFDHGVRSRTHSRVHEQVGDVLQSAVDTIEQVLGFTAAEEATTDRDLAVFDGQDATGVLDGQHHLGHTEGAPFGRAVEDDTVHFVRTQDACALLSDDPPDGIHDVGLAASVRTDHDGYPVGEIDDGPVGKTLEPVQLKLTQIHVETRSNADIRNNDGLWANNN